MSLPRTSVLVLPLSCTPSPWSSRSFSCRTTLQTLSSNSSTRSALCWWLPHPVLHPPPMSIPGIWMSSLSLLCLPVNGSLRLDVHCTLIIQSSFYETSIIVLPLLLYIPQVGTAFTFGIITPQFFAVAHLCVPAITIPGRMLLSEAPVFLILQN